MKHLRTILRLNAASCIGFGLLFLVLPESTGAFLGAVPSSLLLTVGLALVFNGAHLLVGASRPAIRSLEVIYFSAGDIAWFIATAGLLATGLFVTNSAGQWAAIIVALFVLGLGLAQLWVLAEATGSGVSSELRNVPDNDDLLPTELSRGRAIAVSWMGMKTWIKIWLFVLNGLFLVSLLYLPEPAARLTLAAYVASGPLLAAMMIWQRGLTRLLGLAHLIPWLPLTAYLSLRLSSDIAGSALTPATAPSMYYFFLILLIAIVFCMILDAYDCWRWMRGDRFRLGSKNAVMAGASQAVRLN